jgi:hypothetical protein
MAREERKAGWRAQAYEKVFGVTYQIALWIDWVRKVSILGTEGAGQEQSFVEDITWSDMTAKLRTYGSPEVIREFGKLESRAVRLQSFLAERFIGIELDDDVDSEVLDASELAFLVKECSRLFERTVRINRIMLNELNLLTSSDDTVLAPVPPAGTSFESRRKARERINLVVEAW